MRLALSFGADFLVVQSMAQEACPCTNCTRQCIGSSPELLRETGVKVQPIIPIVTFTLQLTLNALESLGNCGVCCKDREARNILDVGCSSVNEETHRVMRCRVQLLPGLCHTDYRGPNNASRLTVQALSKDFLLGQSGRFECPLHGD